MMLTLLLEAALRSAALMGLAWLALRLLRVTNPFTQMAVWVGVLGFSLIMPLLMRLAPTDTMAVPLDGIRLWLRPAAELVAAAPTTAGEAAPGTVSAWAWVDWRIAAMTLYLLVAGVMLLRLAAGMLASLRLRSSALPQSAPWTGTHDVRVSTRINVPLTIAGSILLPPDHVRWTDVKRRAVLAHEASHIQRGDYYTLLLAAIHRALFWFSPVAWWLNNHLAELAEANSDTDALEQMEDRLNYAEILVEMAHKASRLPAGLAMARPATVAARVDRILAGGTLPLRMNAARWVLVLALLAPAAIATAGTNGVDKTDPVVAARMVEQQKPRTAVAMDPATYDKFAGYYEMPFTASRPLKVYRDGTRLMAHVIGQTPMEFFPESQTKFFSKEAPVQGTFQLDTTGKVTSVVLHQNGHELPTPRIDDAKGKALEQALAARVASNKPLPGSEAALRAHIAQIKAGKIDRDGLLPDRADGVIAVLPKIQAEMLPLGELKKLEFRRVDEGGMDVYRATYDKGVRDWWVLVTPDGKLDSMWFGPAA
ncbi:M56 family metallopeptidase [Niveispirillum sp. KHB5.9]|uniref:M56 family metallopeptidase n=1 Tax=Niveispirillum sp. KHB5.9 TaxID=3400269 RepID=UPI003A857DE2